MELVEALDASGCVCTVGAGGKKSTLYTLARRLDRAVVTATVRIPIFDDEVRDVVVTEDPIETVRKSSAWPLGVVPEREREDRYRGYDPAVVAELADAVGGEVDAVLVKADGARTRWLKAPDEREPQLPRTADTVLPIASARVVGKPLAAEHVHRPERVAAITGLAQNEEINADDVAAVVASSAGGLKDVPAGATVIPVVNMVDDDALESTARRIAEGILDRTGRVERVVLTRMTAEEPLVGILN